ncbi:MAG: hypothetical protein PHX16_00525 [Syntrophaceticus sp.]|nr:hypothetical protein [Syntrophaceticus sp.]MDD3314305.1 hypothetical protein [Syntrophaceticus sp.]MDD4359271.1 hypothetical protein [Syntrophaceticus sp.]MDD4782119.1 hypothetical protein [Syntrophaceticus sp.]
MSPSWEKRLDQIAKVGALELARVFDTAAVDKRDNGVAVNEGV